MAIFSTIGAWITAGFNAIASSFLVANFGFYGAAAIGQAVGQIGAAAAAMAFNRALTPKINIPVQEVQAVISQTDAPRRVYVGQALVGGIRAFFDVKDGVLYQLVVASHGRIEAFDQFWIDGVAQTLDGTAVIDSDQEGFVFVTTRTGAGDGGDYPVITTQFPALWPATRLLQRQATFLVRSKAPKGEDFSKVFPKAYNTLFQWEIRGSRIYDPRTDATSYSDNAALVIAHYLTHPDGYRLTSAEVDWDSVAALADWCDLPVPQRAGGTAPNIRLWGYWTLDEEPAQVLDRMRASSGIRVYEMQNGKVGLIGGPFGTPACTLTAKDISRCQTKEAISEREGYNVLRLHHMSAAAAYEVSEADRWVDAARLAQEGEIAQELRLEMCPSTSQCRRLGKRQMHDDNRAKVEIITNLVGLKARYPAAHGQRHTIMLDYQPQDGSGRVIQGEYEVLDHEFDPVDLQCRIALAKIDRASESWNAATEEGDPPVAAAELASDPAPEIDATVTQVVIHVGENTGVAMLEVEAIEIAGRDDLSVQARYRRSGASKWTDMQTTGLTAQSGPVNDGAVYDVQARFRGVFKGIDAWDNIGPITITVDAVPPGQPSELIPSPSGAAVHLSWRNPTGSFARIRIYRGTTTSFEAAALIGSTGGASGQISEYRDNTAAAATQYRYWVAAANGSGVQGDPAGPATITTT